jgi:hypothetical protein
VQHYARIQNPTIAYEDHRDADALWFDVDFGRDGIRETFLIIDLSDAKVLLDHFNLLSIEQLHGKYVVVNTEDLFTRYVGPPPKLKGRHV